MRVDLYLFKKQKTKIQTTFGTWAEPLIGVPHGSVLQPLLSKIYKQLPFSQDIDICNLANNMTPFACDQALETVVKTLEKM